jgi:hypothetical protein
MRCPSVFDDEVFHPHLALLANPKMLGFRETNKTLRGKHRPGTTGRTTTRTVARQDAVSFRGGGRHYKNQCFAFDQHHSLSPAGNH